MIDSLRNASDVFLSGLFILSAGSLATHTLTRFVPQQSSALIRLLGWVVAALVVGAVTFIFGHLGLLYRTTFFLFWMAIVAMGARPLVRDLRRWKGHFSETFWNYSVIEKLLVVFIILRALIIFLGGTLQWPFGGSEADVLHYHLVLPRLFLEQHSMADLSWSIPNRYPLFIHMLHLSGYAVTGPLFAKTLVFSAFIGAQFVLFSMISRTAERPWPLWAVAIFGGVPAVVIQAGSGMLDLLTLIFLLLSFEGLLRYRSHGERLAFLMSALSAGIVASSRAFTVTYAILLTGLLVISGFSSRMSLSHRLKEGFLYLTGIAVVYFPWVIRAYLHTGNPIYPLGFSWFGGLGLDADRAAGLKNVAFAYGMGKGPLQALSLPWDMTFHSAVFDYPIGPVFLAWIPILILFCSWKETRFPLLAMVAYAALWFVGSQQMRYLYFSLAIFFALFANAMTNMARNFRVGSIVCSGFLGVNILLSCVQAQRQYGPGWKRLATGEPNASYLRRYVRHGESLEMVRQNVPESARVLVLDTWPEYLFYFPRAFVQGGAGVLTTNFWDARKQELPEFSQKLKENKINFIFADKGTEDLNRYVTAGRGVLIHDDGTFALYRLDPA